VAWGVAKASSGGGLAAAMAKSAALTWSEGGWRKKSEGGSERRALAAKKTAAYQQQRNRSWRPAAAGACIIKWPIRLVRLTCEGRKHQESGNNACAQVDAAGWRQRRRRTAATSAAGGSGPPLTDGGRRQREEHHIETQRKTLGSSASSLWRLVSRSRVGGGTGSGSTRMSWAAATPRK